MRIGGVLVLLAIAADAAAQVRCDDVPEGPGSKKARAGEHYRRGQELYAQGEYESAIPEFRAAHCLLPAPEALYNVAQSYERLVDYENAVRWFEAYLSELPRSQREEARAVENRLRVLRKLPARIRVSTEPPGAALRLVGDDGTVVEGKANAEPLRVAAGSYQLRLELDGFLPVTEAIRAEIGQPYTYAYRLAPQTGLLRVTARPRDARILVDERVVGAGVYQERVPVGEHTVTIEAPLRPPESRTVRVAREGITRLHVDLQPARPRNGKVELLIASTAFGVVEAGLVASALADNRVLIGGLALAGGAAGFLAPLVLLPREVPTGQTSLMIGGRVWGAIEGLGLATLAYGDPASADNRVAASLLVAGGSVLGGLGFGVVARRLDVSAGEAALVNSGGVWGTTSAALLLAAVDADEEIVGPVLLGGLNLGLIAGGVLASQFEPSRGRVFLVDLAGLAGIVSGTALAALVQKNESVPQFALGGLGVGLIVGTLVTRSVDADQDLAAFASVTPGGTLVMGLGGAW
jgi:hypothetical protein